MMFTDCIHSSNLTTSSTLQVGVCREVWISDVRRFALRFHETVMQTCQQVFQSLCLVSFRRIARSSKCSSFDGFHVKPFASDVNVNRYNSSSDLHVRAVAASSHSDIVLDSGSDVTLLPIAMAALEVQPH